MSIHHKTGALVYISTAQMVREHCVHADHQHPPVSSKSKKHASSKTPGMPQGPDGDVMIRHGHAAVWMLQSSSTRWTFWSLHEERNGFETQWAEHKLTSKTRHGSQMFTSSVDATSYRAESAQNHTEPTRNSTCSRCSDGCAGRVPEGLQDLHRRTGGQQILAWEQIFGHRSGTGM